MAYALSLANPAARNLCGRLRLVDSSARFGAQHAAKKYLRVPLACQATQTHKRRTSGTEECCMTARDWFEDIRSRVLALQAAEQRVDLLRSQTLPKGQQFDAIGHGGGSAGDASAALVRYIEASEALKVARTSVNKEIDRALLVLYGESGRGGLSKARDVACADCLCGYYLQGMTWPQVARDLMGPERAPSDDWCRMKAQRAFMFLDRHGLESISHI